MQKKVVIKIGSSILMTKRNKLDEFRLSHIASQIKALKEENIGIILVISGAVACGSSLIDISDNQNLRQAASGIGQVELISKLQRSFKEKSLQIAQLLLTKEQLSISKYRENLKTLLNIYAEKGVIPVINENDVIDLNSFGGNDYLASKIATLVKADEVLILSSWKASTFGVGGGESKKEVLHLLESQQIKGSILDGRSKNIILNTII